MVGAAGPQRAVGAAYSAVATRGNGDVHGLPVAHAAGATRDHRADRLRHGACRACHDRQDRWHAGARTGLRVTHREGSRPDRGQGVLRIDEHSIVLSARLIGCVGVPDSAVVHRGMQSGCRYGQRLLHHTMEDQR